MFRKQNRKRRGRARSKPRRRSLIASLTDESNRKRVRSVFLVLLATLMVSGVAYAAARTRAYVYARVSADLDRPRLIVPGLSGSLRDLVEPDLQADVADLLTGDRLGDRLCRDVADRLGANGWIAEVVSVQRRYDGTIEVDARYRHPSAMVQTGSEFLLVDDHAVRLPGDYLYDPAWALIQGVQQQPPRAGASWDGEDIRAGLRILSALADEPFRGQITAVLVDNCDGRVDRRREHIALATDRAGGRIRWGSAPGREVAENTIAQKLTILRENYQQTGRADAGHPVIDVSLFPDRYTIPRD